MIGYFEHLIAEMQNRHSYFVGPVYKKHVFAHFKYNSALSQSERRVKSFHSLVPPHYLRDFNVKNL